MTEKSSRLSVECRLLFRVTDDLGVQIVGQFSDETYGHRLDFCSLQSRK